jgi:hypothetical protein
LEGCERFYGTIRGLDENELGKLKLIHVVEDHKKRVQDAC